MKITKEQLIRVIQEELDTVMNEVVPGVAVDAMRHALGGGGSKSKGRDDELSQAKMQNLFKAIKDHGDRLAKIERKIGLRGMPIAKGPRDTRGIK